MIKFSKLHGSMCIEIIGGLFDFFKFLFYGLECGVSIIHEIFLECLWKMTCHFLVLIFIGKYSLFVPGTNNSDLHLSLDWFFYAYMSYTLRTQEVSCWNSRSMLYFRCVLGALNTIAFTYQKRSMLAIFSLHWSDFEF